MELRDLRFWPVVFCVFVLLDSCWEAESAWGDDPAMLRVVTGVAEPLGNTGMMVNAVIHSTGQPTTYSFEYGPTAAYGTRTAVKPLPPRLNAYYRETWDGNLGGWQGGMNSQDLVHHPTGGATGGFVRFREPSGHDPNHVDGIGTLHLCKYMYPGPLLGASNNSLQLGGGDPDFRDAKVSISVRGNDWKANGTELVWWTQSQSNIEVLYDERWRRANWAYTGFSLADRLRSGKWETVEYRLWNDSTSWSYGGNNLAQKRPNYEYWSIDDSQRHLNNDFFHLLTFVDPNNPPTGSIDFDELTVAYRNYSLLIPSNGGSLVSSPKGDADSAKALTDGWRHGDQKMWESGETPAAPLEFVWKFEKPVTIDAVQIHQHTRWPSKGVEVFVSDDGKQFTALKSFDLPASSPLGPNFAFGLVKPAKPVGATYFKLVIVSGHQAERWGLGEVELFGKGAEMSTEPGENRLTGDLTGLEPGKTYHYRLVAQTSSGIPVPSHDATFTVPGSKAPHVVSGNASQVESRTAKLEGRMTPMGLRTNFWFEYGVEGKFDQRTPKTYGGLQITPRAVFATLTGLTPGMEYRYRLVAENELGTAVSGEGRLKTPSP